MNHLLHCAFAASLLLWVAACGLDEPAAATNAAPSVATAPQAPDKSTANGTSRPQRVFISGHSLTDQPVPDYLAEISGSLGSTLDWDRQYAWGTTLRQRTEGTGQWSGYRFGVNRTGESTDVLHELRSAGASPQPYDTLVIAEMHNLLSVVVSHDTVRSVRHFHDRFIEANPRGQTWLFEAWLDVSDKADPRRWIAYERSATKVWQCVVTRINASLEAEGRTERIASLPVGAALAHLVEKATSEGGVAGIGTGQPGASGETLDRLFTDNVHLTRLGGYYIALASYAVMFAASPAGAWAPPELSAAQAASLQAVATEFAAQHRLANERLSLEECRSFLRSTFIGEYAAYYRDTEAIQQLGVARAYLRWARQWFAWQRWVWSRSNPFFFDPATDAKYWHPPPRIK